MEKAKLMQKKLEEQRKLPKKIKDKLNKVIFANWFIAIIITIYLLTINILYFKQASEKFINIVKCLSIFLIIIDIIIFEIGYRKDKIALWIYGLEVLICNILVLFTTYTYIYTNEMTRRLLMLSPIFLFIYYIGKTIILHIIETKKHLNNLSDVKEIIKVEEAGYLDDIKIEKTNNITKKENKK